MDPVWRIPVGPQVAWMGPEQTCDTLASVFSTACLPSGVLSYPVEESLPFQGTRSCSVPHLALSLVPHLSRTFHSRPLHLFLPPAWARLRSFVLCLMITGKSCALEGTPAHVLMGNELWPCLRWGVRKRARVRGSNTYMYGLGQVKPARLSFLTHKMGTMLMIISSL